MSIKKLKSGQFGYMSDLVIGQKARVTKIQTLNPAFKRKLLDMGITRGTVVIVKKISPLGDPIDILIRGYELCLRKDDLQMIGVVVV